MVTKAIGEVCGECRGRTYVIERRGDRAHARVCACSAQCTLCDGRGYAYEVQEKTFSAKVGPKRYEVLVPCVCAHRAKKLAKFNEVGLPGVVAHADFDNYQPAVPEQGLALSVARDFALSSTKTKISKGFILSGPVGSGKTHLLGAALKYLVLEVGVQAKYVEISLLYATIRNGFQQGKSGGEIIGPMSEVDVLAIDELGNGRGSQFELETLDELIARRYNAGLTTLFATNYSLESEKKNLRTTSTGHHATEDLKTAVRESELLLRDRVKERIYSRLCQMCTFVELPKETPDQRRMIQENSRPHLPQSGMRTKR